jgi:hypothetical protein
MSACGPAGGLTGWITVRFWHSAIILGFHATFESARRARDAHHTLTRRSRPEQLTLCARVQPSIGTGFDPAVPRGDCVIPVFAHKFPGLVS